MKLKLYLAGAIRTDRGDEDYKWRRAFAAQLGDRAICMVPSDAGVADGNKLRRFTGSAYMTYRTDLQLIQQSDIVVANLLPLNDGYPSIGTMFELGFARAHEKHILAVAGANFAAHPFVAFGCDGVFSDVSQLHEYLEQYLEVVAGHSRLLEVK